MRNWKILYLPLIAICLGTINIQAQSGPREVSAVLVQLDYGLSFPVADLKKRFGQFSSIGTTPVIYLHENHWTFGGNFHYHFGRDVKTDVLKPLRDQYGQIIGSNTQPATVVLRMRAIQLGLHGSKIFNFSKSASVHGIEVGLTVGYLQHWIRIQDNSNTATQITDGKIKGYDRLSGGLFYEPHIAYTLMTADEGINIKAGIKYNGSFTRSLRKYNYDTRKPVNESRNDGFFTVFFNYSLPIYFNAAGESRYY